MLEETLKNKGLGSDVGKPTSLLTPSPAVVDQYFIDQLRYSKLTPKKEDNPFIARYSKVLSPGDKPVFDELADEQYISNIVIDLYTGRVMDHYLEARRKDSSKMRMKSYQECPPDPNIGWLFKWHLNLVRMTREYLKGGWLCRDSRQKELETAKGARIFLNAKGLKNILESAKPALSTMVAI